MTSVTIYEEMIGEVFVSVNESSDVLTFVTANGVNYEFFHSQDCCENVYIDDIIGDLTDLVNSPLVEAEVVTSYGDENNDSYDSVTHTWYKFSTLKGAVTVKWIGSSNGYYSESVDFRIY